MVLFLISREKQIKVSKLNIKTPIIVALDVDHPKEAILLAESLNDLVGAYKIGPRLLLRSDEAFVKRLADIAPVFIDQKFYDIPSTMISAVQASFDQGASLVTVHALAGGVALEQLALLENKLQGIRDFHIFCVTILTSFSSGTLPSNMKNVSILDHVKILVDLTVDSGLKGIVCSPHEASEIRKIYNDLNIITPGVRLHKAQSLEDQKRVMSPQEAILNGASALVIGRPIISSQDPRKTLENILAEMH